jgi:hypothetical protein
VSRSQPLDALLTAALNKELEQRTLKRFDQWHEDYGPALWWKILPKELGEPAQYVGSPNCSDWPWSEDDNGTIYWVAHPNVIVPEHLL